MQILFTLLPFLLLKRFSSVTILLLKYEKYSQRDTGDEKSVIFTTQTKAY